MRILLLNQFFWPDSAATSQLLTDVARQLAAEGHEIHAICADAGYAPSANDDAPRVIIHRIRSSPFVRGRVGRVLSYASFYALAATRSLTLPKFDVVVTLTTPPLLSLIGNTVKIIRGARHFIWEMDVYPDVAVDLGYFKRNRAADRITGALADWSRRNADGIIALGECMKQRLVARGIPAGQIEVAENWADSREIPVLSRPGDPNKLVLLYSGNLGLAHDLATVMTAMRSLRADPRFQFVFVGSGSSRQELADFAKAEHITSLELRPYVQRASLGESLAAGDIGLVTQRDACCGSVVPSKVYGIMAAGRPVLFIGPVNATPALIIRRFDCGWHIPCGDSEALTQLLQHLANHPEEVKSAGLRARQALLQNFDLPLGTARISAILCGNPVSSIEGLLALPEQRC